MSPGSLCLCVNVYRGIVASMCQKDSRHAPTHHFLRWCSGQADKGDADFAVVVIGPSFGIQIRKIHRFGPPFAGVFTSSAHGVKRGLEGGGGRRWQAHAATSQCGIAPNQGQGAIVVRQVCTLGCGLELFGETALKPNHQTNGMNTSTMVAQVPLPAEIRGCQHHRINLAYRDDPFGATFDFQG